MILRFIFCLLIAISINSSKVFAENNEFKTCYSPDNYAAEQMVRFQTQMMVIGMVCKEYSSTMGNSYELYQTFSQNHQRLIRRYEQRLVNLYKSEEVEKPVKSLHELRTQVANSISQYAMRVSPPKFCATLLPRLERVIMLGENDIESMVSTVSENQDSTRPLCLNDNNTNN